MRVSNVRIEKPRPSRRAFRFKGLFYRDCRLFGLLARPTASVLLARGSHAPVVLHAKLSRGNASTLVAKERGGVHFGILQEVIYQRQGSAKILPAGSRPVLWQGRASFQDKVRFRDEVF
jgi:hypothetical protein